MTKLESAVGVIPASQNAVYEKLSDLNNLDKVKDRPPQDRVKNLSFDKENLPIEVSPTGKVVLQIVEKEPRRYIKFVTTSFPLLFNLWIQIMPVTEAECKMKLTTGMELNPFTKTMVQRPLQERLRKMAGTLSLIKYQFVNHQKFMVQELWGGSVQVNKNIECLTAGRGWGMDLYLARHDVLGPTAHITTLKSIGLPVKDRLSLLFAESKSIYVTAEKGEFVIEEGVEDVHSRVELMLTRKLGDIGKKTRSGRSRNDQMLLDLKLFTRTQIKEVAEAVEQLFHVPIVQNERYKNVLIPGYTHLRIAMSSSFELQFGAHTESLVDSMLFLQAIFRMYNCNPLGFVAGHGSSFPLNHTMATWLLGLDSLNYNMVYAQMGHGKTERNVVFTSTTIVGTPSGPTSDACLFNSQNFGFVKLPDDCTTGSSIMPHRKDSDVFELTRAKCSKLQSLPQ